MGQALKLDPTLAQAITSTPAIVRFRHILVHHYGKVDDQVVWGILQDKLPLLRAEVDAVLDEAESADRG